MNHREKGTTLIELLAVCSIIGVLIMVITPNMANVSEYFLKAYGRQLCIDLRQVRAHRIAYQSNYRISLGESCYQVLNNLNRIKQVNMPKGYEIVYDLDKPVVKFTTEGVPKYGGTTITILHKKTGKYVEITIVPVSGRTLLKDEIRQQ